MKKKVFSYLHAILTVGLAALFIYAGVSKFIPKERAPHPKAKTAYTEAIASGSYKNPIPFRLTVKMMKASGFLHLVGVLQIIAGLLMVIPATRLIGLIILFPIVLNIFLLHTFMNNDMNEVIKTGAFTLLNGLFIAFYWKQLKALLGAQRKI